MSRDDHSINEGDRTKRVIIGFRRGSGELKTHVEGYLVTQRGNRLLGSRQIDTAGAKKPGLLVPGIVTAVTANPASLVVSSVLNIRGERKKMALRLSGARPSERLMRSPRN